MTETTTIRGILIPDGWDKKGEVISTAIATYHEEKYKIVNNKTGRRLMSLLHKRVILDGVVKDQDTVKTIYVKKFRIDKHRI